MGTMPPGVTPETGKPQQEYSTSRMPADAAGLAEPFTLRNGELAYMRAIRPDDTHRLQAFHTRLSANTIVHRYFQWLPKLSDERADHLTHLDYENRMALVATTSAEPDAPIIAVVQYDRIDATTAEAAFMVEDPWQGKGISTHLFKSLAAYARSRGITTIVAEILWDNARMFSVLRHAGFPNTMHYDSSSVELRLDISAETEQPAAEPSQPKAS